MARRLLALVALVAAALLAAWFLSGRGQDRANALQSADSAPESTAVDAAREAAGLAAPAELARLPVPAAEPVAPHIEPAMSATPAVTANRLHGVVTPAAGRSDFLETVTVHITDRLGEARHARCEKGGAYSFEDLPAGRYWAHALGSVDGETRAEVEVACDTRLDLVLQPHLQVLVRVVDELGKPAQRSGLLAVATSDDPGPWFDAIRGSRSNPFGVGRFLPRQRLGEDAPPDAIGALVLDTPPPLHVNLLVYQHVLESRRVESGTDSVTFVLASDDPRLVGGGLRLRAVDARTREPLAKPNLLLEGLETSFLSAVDGVFEAKDLQPGLYVVSLFAGGSYGNERLSVRVPPGEVVDLGDVPLVQGLSIAGQVFDESGQAGVFLIQFDPCQPDGRVGTTGSNVAFETKETGSFRYDGLKPGHYRLAVFTDAAKGQAETVVVVEVGEVPLENVRIVVARGVSFSVDPAGRHAAGASFTVIDERGVRLLARPLSDPTPARVLLAPGRYTVEFRSSRDDPIQRTQAVELVRDPVVIQML
ncbi:MAG: hypothetical protein NTY35_03880 [Planctomycetota bacterium]|nr:hypothetical protein [Planctomycetota bacterium]